MATAARTENEAQLARRAAAGSDRAFEAIFERHYQELYRYCAAIVGNAEDAHDAVQNAMLAVLRALPGESREIALKPWLYRIAHNEAIDLIRGRRGGVEELDADSLGGVPGAAEEAESRDRLRRLVADVSRLPERQRGALVMRELSGLGFEEIGAALGTSAQVARQTLYEARLGLRQMSAGREMDCEEVMTAVSAEDRRLLRRRDIKAHLQECGACRDFRAGIGERRADLALIAPLPAAAAAGLLHAVLGGGAASASTSAGAGSVGAGAGGAGAAGAGSTGAGAVGAGSAGAVAAAGGKSILGVAALKGAAAVGVVVAIGVTAADQRGLIDLGGSPGSKQPPAKSAPTEPGRSRGAEGALPPSGAASSVGTASSVAAGTSVDAPPRPGSASKPLAQHAAVARPKSPGPSAAAPASPQPTSAAPESGPGRHLGQTGEAPGQVDEDPAHSQHPEHPQHPVHPEKPSHPGKPAEAAKPPHPEHPPKPTPPKAAGNGHAADEGDDPSAEAPGHGAAAPPGQAKKEAETAPPAEPDEATADENVAEAGE